MNHASWILPFTLLPLLLSPLSQDHPEWRTIFPPDRSFSIQFPAPPKLQLKTLKAVTGTIDVRVYLLEPEEGRPGYFLSYSEAASGTVGSTNPQGRLAGARKGALSSTKGELVTEQKITLGQHPGLELLIATTKEHYLKIRIYAVNNRLYQIFVVGTRDHVNSTDGEKFLRSFKLKAE